MKNVENRDERLTSVEVIGLACAADVLVNGWMGLSEIQEDDPEAQLRADRRFFDRRESMVYGDTFAGLEYNTEVYSAAGCLVTLFVSDETTEDQIERAKRAARAWRDVVEIHLRKVPHDWLDKVEAEKAMRHDLDHISKRLGISRREASERLTRFVRAFRALQEFDMENPKPWPGWMVSILTGDRNRLYREAQEAGQEIDRK